MNGKVDFFVVSKIRFWILTVTEVERSFPKFLKQSKNSSF